MMASPKVANMHERTSIDGWHKRLGHPSSKIVHHLVKKFSFPVDVGSDFRDIARPIRARESSLAFEELHDLLVGHEAYLCRLEAATQQLIASANFTKTQFSISGGRQS